MRYVKLSGAGAFLPRRCACCGAPPTTTLKIQKARGLFLLVAAVQTTYTFQVPYCEPCVAHAKAYERASVRGLQMPVVILGAISVFFAIMLGEAWGLDGMQQLAALVGAPAAVAGGFVAWRRGARAAAIEAMRGYHACGGPAVMVDDFDESSVTLGCMDLEFGRLLAEANQPRPMMRM